MTRLSKSVLFGVFLLSFVGFDWFSCDDSEECKKNVPVALIGMHSCRLDAKSQVVELPAEEKKKPSENRLPSKGARSGSPSPMKRRSLTWTMAAELKGEYGKAVEACNNDNAEDIHEKEGAVAENVTEEPTDEE